MHFDKYDAFVVVMGLEAEISETSYLQTWTNKTKPTCMPQGK